MNGMGGDRLRGLYRVKPFLTLKLPQSLLCEFSCLNILFQRMFCPMIVPNNGLCLDHPIHPPRTETDPWDTDLLDNCGYKTKLVRGVFQIYKNQDDYDNDTKMNYKVDIRTTIFIQLHLTFQVPDLSEFVTDMHHMCAMIADGPLKSFFFSRLSYLHSKYQLHVLLNELRELAAQKAVPHRDFYNCRKVSSIS